MAFGLHWEWRGFGAVSGRFAGQYCSLLDLFPEQEIEDSYLWVPGLEVNAKFREGAEGGLKFKRLKNGDGPLEQWEEDRREVFEFPLEREAWDTLSKVLQPAKVHLPSYPMKKPAREEVVKYLQEAGCKTLTVKKVRGAKVWQGPHGNVKVEWACISSPQTCISIGLETWAEGNPKPPLADELAKADIRAAIKGLRLDAEPLRVLNYMQAVEMWVADKRI